MDSYNTSVPTFGASPSTQSTPIISPDHQQNATLAEAPNDYADDPQALVKRKRLFLDTRIKEVREKLTTSHIILLDFLGSLTKHIGDLKLKQADFRRRMEVTSQHMPLEQEPENILERLEMLLTQAEGLSEECSSLPRFLDTTPSIFDVWDELFDELERQCLPSAFWFDRAVDFRRRIADLDLTEYMTELLDLEWDINPRSAERFCRLPHDEREEILISWQITASNQSFAYQESSVTELFPADLQEVAGYDTRRVSNWAVESFTFECPDREESDLDDAASEADMDFK
ncbi:hypothetical protein F4805DRAFT_451794 [Annulohypoxylon moriforme]|nr:hypothetical protein F4805DRAFT_451794 [Annulohypoxylon moriforme]